MGEVKGAEMTIEEVTKQIYNIFGNGCLSEDVHNISKGPNKNDVYVEATARIGKAKVVVSCRPEYRDTEPFVKQIIEAFDSINV